VLIFGKQGNGVGELRRGGGKGESGMIAGGEIAPDYRKACGGMPGAPDRRSREYGERGEEMAQQTETKWPLLAQVANTPGELRRRRIRFESG
jgi:hypothetical protein